MRHRHEGFGSMMAAIFAAASGIYYPGPVAHAPPDNDPVVKDLFARTLPLDRQFQDECKSKAAAKRERQQAAREIQRQRSLGLRK